MSEAVNHWSVEVCINGESILTIESNSLCGKPEFSDVEAEAIRIAARNLLAFIGNDKPAGEWI
jgi:hypothetical protein